MEDETDVAPVTTRKVRVRRQKKKADPFGSAFLFDLTASFD